MKAAKACILLGTGTLAIVASAVIAPSAGATVAAATGAALGNIGASYAGEGILLGFERISALLQLRSASSKLPINHDLARAIRRAHLQALEFLINSFGSDVEANYWKPYLRVQHKEFFRASAKWIRGQLKLVESTHFLSDDALPDAIAEVASLMAGGAFDTDGGRYKGLAQETSALAWSEFIEGIDPVAVPWEFESYFHGDKSVSWYAAAQGFFAQTLNDDRRVRTAVFLERFDALQAIGQSVEQKVAEALVAIRDSSGSLADRLRAVENNIASLRAEGVHLPDLARLAPLIAADVARMVPAEAIARRVQVEHGPRHSVAQTATQVAQRIEDLLAHFVGRDEAWAQLDAHVRSTTPGILMVCAPAGGGKSALLANWTQSQIQGGARVIRHFISNQKNLTTSPAEITGHLLAQLSAVSAVDSELGDSRGQNLYSALRSQTQPTIVVVDGLDEAATLLEPFVEADLPAHVRIVVSARANPDAWPDYLIGWRQRESDRFAVVRFDLPPMTETEVLLWLEEFAGQLDAAEMSGLAERLHATTDGLPLYVSYVLDDLVRQLPFADTPIERRAIIGRLPAPFSDYLAAEMARPPRPQQDEPRWTSGHRQLFALLSLIRGPMHHGEILDVLTGLPEAHIDTLGHRFTRWMSLAGEGKSGLVSLAHPRLADAFAAALTVECEEMRHRLIEWSAKAWQPGGSPHFPRSGAPYPLDWLTLHLTELGPRGELAAAELLADARFLLEQLRDAPAARRRFITAFDRWSALPAAVVRQPWAQEWTGFWAANESAVRSALAFAEDDLLDAAILVEHALADAGSPGTIAPDILRPLANKPLPPLVRGLRRSIAHPHADRYQLIKTGDEMLSWGNDGWVRRYSETGEIVREFRIPCRYLHELYLRDGHLIAVMDELVKRYALDGTRVFGFENLRLPFIAALRDTGRRFVIPDEDGRLIFWSPAGDRLGEFDRIHRKAYEIVESGHFLASRGSKGELVFWTSEGSYIKRWQPRPQRASEPAGGNGANKVIAVEGGFVTVHYDGRLRLWRASRDWKPETILEGCDPYGDCATPFGADFLAWDKQGAIAHWSSDGTRLADFDPAMQRSIDKVHVTERHVFGWGPWGDVEVWSTDGRHLQFVPDLDSRVWNLITLGSSIVTTGADGVIRFWDTDMSGLFVDAPRDEEKILSGKPLGQIQLVPPEISNLPGVARGARYATIGEHRGIDFWDAHGERVGRLSRSNGVYARSLRFIENGFVVWGWGSPLYLWDREGNFLHSTPGEWGTADIAYASGTYLEPHYKTSYRLWIEDGKFVREEIPHLQIAKAYGWSNGFVLIDRGRNEIAVLDADLQSRRVVGTFEYPDENYEVCGDRLVGLDDLTTWSLRDGSMTQVDDAMEVGMVYGVRIDGDVLTAWGDAGKIISWDLAGRRLGRFGHAHGGPVYALRKFDDGFVSLGGDGVIWRWSRDGERVDALVAPGEKSDILISPEGDLVVVGRDIQIYPIGSIPGNSWSRLADWTTAA